MPEVWPLGHALHAEAPEVEYVFTGQAAQALGVPVEKAPAEKVPSGHTAHAAPLLAYWPAGHLGAGDVEAEGSEAHPVAALLGYWPVGQVRQVESPAVE